MIILYIFSLSFEAEKDRKKYFPRITRDLLEKNKLISIKNFANELNVNEGVIIICIDLINPDLQIMKNNRYIKTTQRSISDSELEVIMEQLRQAQIEYDEASSKEK